MQPRQGGVLRLFSWNINNLTSASGSAIPAAAVAQLILQVEVDVVVLQEAVTDSSP